jgi:ribosomal protein L11 methyltransferase
MSHAAIRFDVSGDSRETLEGFFLTHSTFAGAQEHDDGTVTFYIPSSEWNAEFEERIESFCAGHTDVEFLGSEIIEDRDWNAEWEATILPVKATPELVITPSWRMDDAKEMGSKYIITIDPKMSFGTGHHETTRLCLAAMESLEMNNRTVLDLGTGSGVLAIYALLRGAKHAVGIDTDHWAIENTLENRERNEIPEAQFEIRKGTIDVVQKGERFDIILANIHRNILLEIAEQIHSHAMSGAHVVLSGILMYDAEEIRSAYEKAHFAFVRELKENEWACMVFRCE